MNFDRGFIKWQPFNSVIPNKNIISNIKNNEHIEKPTFFPEEIEILNQELLEAYYAHNLIEITIYEENKLKTYQTIITKIDSNTNIINLQNNKRITFSEIVHIKNI